MPRWEARPRSGRRPNCLRKTDRLLPHSGRAPNFLGSSRLRRLRGGSRSDNSSYSRSLRFKLAPGWPWRGVGVQLLEGLLQTHSAQHPASQPHIRPSHIPHVSRPPGGGSRVGGRGMGDWAMGRSLCRMTAESDG